MQQGLWVVIFVAVLFGLALSSVLQLFGVSPWLLVFAVIAAITVAGLPWWLTREGTDWTAFWRRLLWRRDEGHHHAFAGITLHIEDDGRHLWIDSASLMRITAQPAQRGQRESEDALAARHAGHWRRNEKGVLLLRVDAVVQQLHIGRGRDDPRMLRFKHYLERSVLFPAAERRRRAAQG